mmetsp:Transcript_29796/g.79215  ORF Transcript_29796/g.79215 Transcript_29796/m.79215 type:complete len:93 (+) Transcript_29796:350-628(+)
MRRHLTQPQAAFLDVRCMAPVDSWHSRRSGCWTPRVRTGRGVMGWVDEALPAKTVRILLLMQSVCSLFLLQPSDQPLPRWFVQRVRFLFAPR